MAVFPKPYRHQFVDLDSKIEQEIEKITYMIDGDSISQDTIIDLNNMANKKEEEDSIYADDFRGTFISVWDKTGELQPCLFYCKPSIKSIKLYQVSENHPDDIQIGRSGEFFYLSNPWDEFKNKHQDEFKYSFRPASYKQLYSYLKGRRYEYSDYEDIKQLGFMNTHLFNEKLIKESIRHSQYIDTKKALESTESMIHMVKKYENNIQSMKGTQFKVDSPLSYSPFKRGDIVTVINPVNEELILVENSNQLTGYVHLLELIQL